MNNKSKLSLDSFEKWRAIISSDIEDFLTSLPEDVHKKLDYSTDSLDVLGSWLVETYAAKDENAENQQTVGIHYGAIYYVGEVYRAQLEGHWNVHFKELEPDFKFGEEAVIEGFHHDVAICPFLEILLTINYKRPTRLRGILIDFMKMYKSKRIKG